MEHILKIICIIALFLIVPRWLWGQATKTKIALLKYTGGGNYNANTTSLSNLIMFCNENLQTDLAKQPATVEPGSSEIFNYPYVLITGLDNILFAQQEAENLQEYMLRGGFLHIDDHYGLTPLVRKEVEKIFPEDELTEIPLDHPIFHQKYKFTQGLPKINEHDEKRPQALGIIKDERLVLLCTYETNLSDGWKDIDVHNKREIRQEKALQMGANIISYVFTS